MLTYTKASIWPTTVFTGQFGPKYYLVKLAWKLPKCGPKLYSQVITIPIIHHYQPYFNQWFSISICNWWMVIAAFWRYKPGQSNEVLRYSNNSSILHTISWTISKHLQDSWMSIKLDKTRQWWSLIAIHYCRNQSNHQIWWRMKLSQLFPLTIHIILVFINFRVARKSPNYHILIITKYHCSNNISVLWSFLVLLSSVPFHQSYSYSIERFVGIFKLIPFDSSFISLTPYINIGRSCQHVTSYHMTLSNFSYIILNTYISSTFSIGLHSITG